MGRSEDLLFGRLAVAHHMVTPEQLAECVAAQAMSDAPIPLGEVMREKGLITASQFERVRQLQRESLRRIEPVTPERRQSELFGRLVVERGFATQEEVDACLRAQEAETEPGRPERSLGEILVEKGFLTASQVHNILAAQQKVMMVCPACKARFNVVAVRDPAGLRCPRCQGPLVVAQAGGKVLRQDATLVAPVSDVLPSLSGGRATHAGSPASAPAIRPAPITVETPSVGRPTAGASPARPAAAAGSGASSVRPAVAGTSDTRAVPRPAAAARPTPPTTVTGRPSTASSTRLPAAPPSASAGAKAKETSTRLPAAPQAAAALPGPTPARSPSGAPGVRCPICDFPIPTLPDSSGWVKCPECETSFSPK